MDKWYMVTAVGKDQTGIVAAITGALFDGGCHLGEASMARLGDSFTVMMMVRHANGEKTLRSLLEAAVEKMHLHLHVDPVDGVLHHHVIPNLRISVFGADRPGIVAQVTRVLASDGLSICHLETDVAGTQERPIYVMHIEAKGRESAEALQSRLRQAVGAGLDVRVADLDLVIG